MINMDNTKTDAINWFAIFFVSYLSFELFLLLLLFYYFIDDATSAAADGDDDDGIKTNTQYCK